ncbi:hypothetical protein PFISCL1PPCAC_2493 [Pristionchus fissidentatus]|uniref:Uncharacterized protein n=1 Tax=Pristionchus fissidentatus TaxID=1538716 RepID=A0AAV5UXF7_9BILA|nr:hypothetical protein PFISCL1PPCAC_2493 [Pristionchus fissidentatus]
MTDSDVEQQVEVEEREWSEEDEGATARSIVSESAIEEIRGRIIELFKTFYEAGDGEWLEIREVGNVLRCLGFSPTLEDVEQFTDHLMKTGEKVHFNHFLPRIVAAYENREWPRHSREELMAAFETLTETKLISKDKLVAVLTTLGEPLTQNEVQSMMNHLAVNKEGNVDWGSYVDEVIDHEAQRM